MDNLANFADAFFVYAMGRGVRGHQAGKLVAGLHRLGFQVLEVDVAGLVAIDNHHLHTGHLRRRRVGAVG
ncbi:hypothetical protein D3C76_1848830 [compost metagenome]